MKGKLNYDQRVVRNHCCGRRVTVDAAAFVSRWFPRTIKIPARLRDLSLEALPGGRRISTRLAHVLRRSGTRMLGDLHGRRVGDFAWQRNCGLKTLQELDSLASAFTKRLSSSRESTADGMAFAFPKSVCGLRFDELPITKRLTNVVRTHGLETLGTLHGRAHSEFLQYNACGWRTLAELHQLIERAVCGEFDVVRIDKSRAVAELLTLLEQGIAKLVPRDRLFVLAKIGGMTFAEIGRRYGFTRAWVHKAVLKALGTLRKTYGPRIPQLVEITKQHWLSVPNATKGFRLPKTAQLRLIAELDKIAGWPQSRRQQSQKARTHTIKQTLKANGQYRPPNASLSRISGLPPSNTSLDQASPNSHYWRHSVRHTTADRMAAHRKLNRRRVREQSANK